MPINRIQFQKSLSLLEFHERFGTEAACEAALLRARWPEGFVCPARGERRHTGFFRAQTRYWQCSCCRHQTTLKAGTLFANSRLQLRQWFLAMFLISQAKSNVSALLLSRSLGVRYRTAWRLKQKLMEAMRECEDARQLHGTIQIDDAYLGGERPGKPGRGSPNKVPFLAAVAVNEQGHPVYAKLARVPNFGDLHVAQWADRAIRAQSHIVSDGLSCFRAMAQSREGHTRIIGHRGREAAQEPRLKWVNVLLGNLKTALAGTYHAFKFQKYAHRYLSEYAWRFNHRFDMAGMIDALLTCSVRTKPWPERRLRLAETWG